MISILLNCEINDIEYSTHYMNWYHDGSLHLFHTSHTKKPSIEHLRSHPNKIAINSINWSEYFVDCVVCGNHDGSISIWNVNKGIQTARVMADKGYNISSTSWNQLIKEYILVGSTSSRIKLFDVKSMNQITT
jgi:WD40 repeat protein